MWPDILMLRAPLTVFTYSQAGARPPTRLRTKGQCFKLRVREQSGNPFEDAQNVENPYSHTITIMDEFHNISERYGKVHERKKLRALKDWLTTAKDAVVVGLTATPIISKPDDAEELLRVIRGPARKVAQTTASSRTLTICIALYPTLSDLNGNPRVNDTMGTVRRVPLHRSEYAIETSKRERSQDAAQTTTTTALAAYESRAKSMFGDLAVYDRIMASSEAKLLVPFGKTDREVDAFQNTLASWGPFSPHSTDQAKDDLPSTKFESSRTKSSKIRRANVPPCCYWTQVIVWKLRVAAFSDSVQRERAKGLHGRGYARGSQTHRG